MTSKLKIPFKTIYKFFLEFLCLKKKNLLQIKSTKCAGIQIKNNILPKREFDVLEYLRFYIN